MKKIEYKKVLICLLFLVLGFCLLNINGFSWYNNDFTTYGVNALSRIGKYFGYFLTDNISKNITPQIISDYLTILSIYIGLSYKDVMSILYIITCIILLFGILYGIKVFIDDKYNVLAYGPIFALEIIFITCSRLGNTISGNILWVSSYYHQSVAIASTVWVIPLLKKKKWKSAMIVAMIATLFQMHIGTYCFLMCAVVLVLEMIETREVTVFKHTIWWIVPVVPFVCSILSGNKEKVFSNTEYVELYGRFRHPHHMIPSSWDKIEFVKYAVIIALFYVLSKCIFKLSKNWNRLILIYAFLTAAGLFVNWVFTDIYPIPFILKLQPARMITIMNLLLLYCILQFAIKAVEKKDFLTLGYLFFMSMQSNEMNIYFILSLILVGIIAIRKDSKIIEFSLYVLLVFLFGFEIWNGDIGIRLCIVLGLMLVGVFIISKSEVSKWIHSILALVIIALALTIGTNVPNYTENNVDFDLLYLAEWFKENTTKDEQFFADPLNSNLAAFTLFSERGTYCFYKNVPIFDEALLEWKNRLQECGIIEEDGERYVLKSMELTEIEQIELCGNYDIKYILVEGEGYFDTGKVRVIQERGKYRLLKIISQ